jgi:hypothetical protein
MDRGYYQTPNINIPLNNREPGHLAQVAIDQLAPFVERAKTWPLREVYREDDNNNSRHGMACSLCDQIVYFISDPRGILYGYDDSEIQSLIVAHMRQIHESVVLRGTV